MAIIRCTQKLLAEMAVQPIEMAEVVSSDEAVLVEWYANLTVIQRQKIVVFINPTTLFVVPVFGLRRSDLRNLRTVFLTSLISTLSSEGVESATIQKLTDCFETIQIAKTCNRKTLGCLNDVIRMLTYQIGEARDLTPEAVADVSKRLNRIPWVKTEFVYAIAAMEPVLQQHLGWKGRFEQ